MKKKHFVLSYAKQVHVPADLRPLGSHAQLIINQMYSYYANRRTDLIGRGNRAKRKKGKRPAKGA